MKSISLFALGSLFVTGFLQAAPTFTEVNTALGLPLFSDESLWDDSAAAVSRKLQWPQESAAGELTSYRNYAPPTGRVAGARVYSEALYGKNDKPESLSFIFTNQGDFGDYFKVAEAMEAATGSNRSALQRKAREIERDFPKELTADSATLSKNLTTLLGPPVVSQNTMSGNNAEKVESWVWQGQDFLVSTLPNGFLALRIVPVAETTTVEKNPLRDAELKSRLVAQLQHRPNQDVIVGDLPMVDQGPKGFCVPATLERYFRYLGIPCDMYVLALQAQTGMGGGTSFEGTSRVANQLARANGRRFEKVAALRINNIARYIDDGLPIMWGIQMRDEIDRDITDRMAQRRATPDAAQWKAILKKTPKPKKLRANSNQPPAGHMCLIIGYNKATDEVAISDSWGPQFAERWMTMDEFDALSDNLAAVVSF